MVKGESLKEMVNFVEHKKGIHGLEILHAEVNKENMIFPQLKTLNISDEFSTRYFERMLNASLKSLESDEKLVHEFGYTYGVKNGLGLGRRIMGIEAPKKVFESMLNTVARNLPLFKVTGTTLSDTTFQIKISNLKGKEQAKFVSGYVESIVEQTDRKMYKKEVEQSGTKIITLHFL